ncbi:MAG: thiamine biosynthesis protein ThiF [Planctomycetaceae bacterium]|nr:thiamine biosynthesis protein ThiF [Planctomycetaceae bacterium]
MTEAGFLIDDEDRYAGFRLISWWDQQSLADARIVVVGAGALGNEVLKNLALLGVGRVFVVDSGVIEASNLGRSPLFRRRDCGLPKAEVAAEQMRDLNPDVHVVACVGDVIGDVGLGVFRAADVVISCLDNREARLWVNRQCWKTKTPWIDGGIQEISGVVKVFVPPDGACYECAMTDLDYQLINLRYSCPLLRERDFQAGRVSTTPTIAAIVGGWQTQEALKLIHQMPANAGQAMVYNGEANRFYTTRFERREGCLSHEVWDDPITVPVSARSHAATALFQAVDRCSAGTRATRLLLERDLVLSLGCAQCGLQVPMLRSRHRFDAQSANCSKCGEGLVPEMTHWVDRDTPRATECLFALGIPSYDIVRVVTAECEIPVLLADDEVTVWPSVPGKA